MPLDEKDIAQVTELMAKLLADQQDAIKKVVSEQANGAVTTTGWSGTCTADTSRQTVAPTAE